ncbi:S-adenosyl-L-methionine-dependent methyltransferase [Gigaspora margarita]|uniref:S-adenosyl-L-methionine-dependent methyltransferase n=1 Tax=Gigaspora margarita TaxID=4874 RepID=A0A8H4AXC6_GIGMA|nr:S-adenosyl-L-methionine-dependent methyltransferase [Gigaspora margarita]
MVNYIIKKILKRIAPYLTRFSTMSTMNNINVNKENSTTFSDSDYNSAAYNTYRPTYSSRLFSKIYDYHASHSSSLSTALDVATGTGYVAKELSKKFQQVYATDISQVMLSSVSRSPNIQYSISAAENLSQFQDSIFDLVTVGQAVHWFDREKFFNEAWRVLKPSGTLAIWGYSYHVVDGYPVATKKFMKLVLETFGDYWNPGNPEKLEISILYKGIALPDELFRNIIWERYEYDEKEGKMSNGESLLSEEWSVERLKNYMKTWSAYKNYMAKYQKENQMVEDPINKLFEELKEEEGWKDDQILKVSWLFVLALAEKKQKANNH